MHPFAYARPTTLAEAVALLEARGPAARILAGGTDLIIRIRDGTARPDLVIDIKAVPELRPSIHEAEGRLVISAGSVMTDIAADDRVRRSFEALGEAASVVGAVQIRNRATLAGNICNASPAADTAPALLVYGAEVVAVGPDGTRRIAIDDFFVRSGQTALRPGELVTAIELPLGARRQGAVHLRRTRRRGHDLASVTLCCAVDELGVTRLAYGSVGPRPVLRVDERGLLADPHAPEEAREAVFDRMFADATPSPRSLRASPEYRLAMLRVLGRRALRIAIERLATGA
ncbi:MAG TPA: xanthine dehydrogenase family protein subunit M [Candidatus Sulfomarinibacteraceae bacterium]|nr:xanthine dehydrogenase family protein subunit M [Candidatus Sulfomarinibacteraceae bacterium]